MLIAATNAQEKDYTCYPRNDYSSDPTCPTVDDDVCDDPNLGGSGGEGPTDDDEGVSRARLVSPGFLNSKDVISP